MYNHITISEKDKAYVDKTIAFIHHETFDEHYPYAGNFAIVSDYQIWLNNYNPCCGHASFDIHCPSGRKVIFCFDYGH